MLEPVVWAGLLNGKWRDLPYEPFRDGVEVHYLYRQDASQNAPIWALLRYAPGASVPLHRHKGLETILVLEGSQSDERGCYDAGSLIANPEGSVHHVWSENGCTVLIQWERPVEILDVA